MTCSDNLADIAKGFRVGSLRTWHKHVTTAGTPEEIEANDNEMISAAFKAKSDNLGKVYISQLDPIASIPASGWSLEPGESISLPSVNPHEILLDSDEDGDGIQVIAVEMEEAEA